MRRIDRLLRDTDSPRVGFLIHFAQMGSASSGLASILCMFRSTRVGLSNVFARARITYPILCTFGGLFPEVVFYNDISTELRAPMEYAEAALSICVLLKGGPCWFDIGSLFDIIPANRN